MKPTLLSSLAALAVLCISSVSFAAAGIAPPSTSFTGSGAFHLQRTVFGGPTEVWVCTLNLNMQTGSSAGGSPPRASGGTVSGGTMTGINCGQLTVGATTFDIDNPGSSSAGGNGGFRGITFYKNGAYYCGTSAYIPFQIVNNGASPSNLFVPSVAVNSDCQTNFNLTTSPDVNIVP